MSRSRTTSVRIATTYVGILRERAKRAGLSIPQYTARMARRIRAMSRSDHVALMQATRIRKGIVR